MTDLAGAHGLDLTDDEFSAVVTVLGSGDGTAADPRVVEHLLDRGVLVRYDTELDVGNNNFAAWDAVTDAALLVQAERHTADRVASVTAFLLGLDSAVLIADGRGTLTLESNDEPDAVAAALAHAGIRLPEELPLGSGAAEPRADFDFDGADVTKAVLRVMRRRDGQIEVDSRAWIPDEEVWRVVEDDPFALDDDPQDSGDPGSPIVAMDVLMWFVDALADASSD